MPDWFNLILDLWPIASAIGPLVAALGFLWLRNKFPDKADFTELCDKHDAMKVEQVRLADMVNRLANDQESAPTRYQLMQELAQMEGRIKGVEAGLTGVASQLKTANDYLQILVERGLGK